MPRTACLIGCGRIGYLLEEDPLRKKPCTHYGGAIAAGIRFTHACDISPARLNAFGDRLDIPSENRFTDYRELLANQRFDLVCIAAWTHFHAPMIIAAARSGAGTIICEKPVSADLKSAQRAISECEQHGTRLIVNHERRFDPAYRKAQSLIERGHLGRIVSIRGSMMTGPYRGPDDPRIGGGPLLHDGTHLLDMVLFFAGPIRQVNGRIERFTRTYGFEDYASASMVAESGATVFIEAGGGTRHFCFELDIMGTEGRLVIGNGYRKLYKARKSSLYTGFRDLKEVPFPAIPRGSCFTNLYRAASRGAEPNHGMNGYASLELIDAIYLSAASSRTINLPLNPARVNIRKIFGFP
jgi:predicted dehydrogenase